MSEFALVNGRCPVCETQVEMNFDGRAVRFVPHDDPNWCRRAAQLLVRTQRDVAAQLTTMIAELRYSLALTSERLSIAERFGEEKDPRFRERVSLYQKSKIELDELWNKVAHEIWGKAP